MRCETLRRVIASQKVEPGAMSQSSASWWIRGGNSRSLDVNTLRVDPRGQIHTPPKDFRNRRWFNAEVSEAGFVDTTRAVGTRGRHANEER